VSSPATQPPRHGTKAADTTSRRLRNDYPEEVAKCLPHLRRCVKPGDLPPHLKAQFMNETPDGRQVHTGKSTWVYIMLCSTSAFTEREFKTILSETESVEDKENIFITTIPVPLTPPTSQIQAAMWSTQFWPCVYRKNNPLGPHPSLVARATDVVRDEASMWMALAHRVGNAAHKAGIGEAMGCVVVQREGGKSQLVAVAGDARWHGEPERTGCGNPAGHCVLRVMSMVAQKLVRHERKMAGLPYIHPNLEFDAFEDRPLLEEEAMLYDEVHPNTDGYLCHGLELYTTHEPCVQCSMGVLHSRMGKIVFCNRMPLTGGMASEQRGEGYPELSDFGGGHGLGLFWRRELNWSLLAWEWEISDKVTPLPPISHTVHA
jgi:tRNA-specific adenosine deaminase 3